MFIQPDLLTYTTHVPYLQFSLNSIVFRRKNTSLSTFSFPTLGSSKKLKIKTDVVWIKTLRLTISGI